MIQYVRGDIFQSPAQVIVNTVNTVGVMGKGLALTYKERYPEMFSAYQKACEKKQLAIGKLMLWYAPDHWILLFPTKQHWRNPSQTEYIEAGLKKFVQTYADKNITSIAFPRLGCGNGELKWEVVRPIMEKYLSSLPISIYIYLGVLDASLPEHKQPAMTLSWLREHAKDMSFNGIRDDIQHCSSIFPIAFQMSSETWSASWENGLHLDSAETSNSPIFIDEDELLSIWDRIRNTGILSISTCDDKSKLVYALLSKIGYLDEIALVCESQPQQEKAGYQLNEGIGRVFALHGV